MRFSNYNHLSGRLSNGGFLLINTLSGAVEFINQDFADTIKEKSTSPFADREETTMFDQEYIDHLLDRGFLTERDSAEEIELAQKIACDLDEEEDGSGIALALVPNMNCNYRCVYCFERQTDSFRKNRHTLLTETQIDIAVTFAVEHGVKEITLFGGEPLNRTNLSQVDYICKKTKDTGIKLRAITNGHDLDTFIPYLGDGPGMISYLQITLDGPADIHDRRRITLDGESSFQHITTNVKAVLTETQVSIGIRVNVDARNVDRIEDLIEQLKAAEILNQERCAMYLAPVIGLSKTRESDFDILRKITALESKYDILYQGSPDFDLAKKIMEALSSCNPLPRNTRSCGANRFATVFSPDGCIYPCLEVVGYPEEASATFDSEGRIHWRKDITDKWLKTRLQYRKKCIACKYALLCDGGCAKHYLDGISTNNNCYQFEERLEDILTNVGNIYFETLNS